MEQPTLVAAGGFGVIAACVFVFVGERLRRRQTSDESRVPALMFVVWWWGLGGLTLLNAATTTAAGLGFDRLSLFVAAQQVNLLVLCVALLGLVYYLVYLYTGNSRMLPILALLYGVYYVLLAYYFQDLAPRGIELQRWRVEILYEREISGFALQSILAFLVLPPILGGLAYFRLFFRVRLATQRYRTLLVSWSIIVWFLSAYVASASGAAEEDWWQILSRAIGLAAALTVLAAYYPPQWIRRRFGIETLDARARTQPGRRD